MSGAESIERDLQLMSIDETKGKLGGVSRAGVDNLIADGELTKVKIGTRAFVTRESLVRFLDRRIAESELAKANGSEQDKPTNGSEQDKPTNGAEQDKPTNGSVTPKALPTALQSQKHLPSQRRCAPLSLGSNRVTSSDSPSAEEMIT